MVPFLIFKQICMNTPAFHRVKHPNRIMIKDIVVNLKRVCVPVKTNEQPSSLTVSIAHRISASLIPCLNADAQSLMSTSIGIVYYVPPFFESRRRLGSREWGIGYFS
jgi:hypothetical protein